MELETLEVLLEVNTARIQESIDRVMPNIEAMMSRIENVTGKSMRNTENHLDIEKGTSQFTKQVEKMNQNFEKMLSNIENVSKKSSENIGNNFSTGVRKARPKVSKEIDAMVNEINAKMGQAKAAQEKVAYLKSQRQDSSAKGDKGKTVKYDEQIARAQASMIKYQDQAKGLAQSLKNEFDAVPNSLNNIARAMDSNEAKFNTMRKNVKDLESKYQSQLKPVGSFTNGFKNTETPDSLKTAQKIQVQSDKMQKLANSNDVLQKEYAQTEARAEALRKALGRINSVLGQSSMATGSAVNGASMTGSGLKQSERAVSKYGGVFSRMSNSISHGFGGIGNGLKNSLGFIGKFGSLFSSTSNKVTQGTNRMTKGTGAFGQSMRYLLPSLIVYQLLGQIITKMASGMMGALKTNEQFSNSLNQVKVNLLTAFYPIYTAILPAINAFMSALATLTGQLASFIANVFGTTYQAAKQGASGLYDNVQAMNDTGSSASKAKEKVDKLQRSLMGFDEINRIGLDNNSDDDSLDGNSGSTPSVDFGKATGNYDTPAWMKNMQKLLQDFFKPFQDAWKNQGQKVIDAWKYALGEVIGLASSIGKSFMEVWTNGTGQRFIENLLILLADMLNIVGDIAKAFKDAWNDDGRGTALIQSIFDMFNGILELLHSIATAFREAWNDGTGESIAANLLEIFTNIFNTIGNLANQFKKAWNEGGTGKDIFSAILGIIDDVLGHINNMTKATSDWAKTLNFTPLLNSIKKLLESIKPLSNKIGDGLEWFYKNVLLPLAKYSIEDLIPAFLDALKGAIDLLSGVIDAFKPAFDFLWNSVLKPLAEWSGGVIVDVLKALGDVLSTIGGWLSEHAEGFSNFVIAFGSFVAAIKIIGAIGTVIEVLSGIFTFLSGIGGLGGVLSAVGTAIGTVVGILGGPITIAIGVAIAAGVLLWKNWDTVKEKAGQLKDWIGEKWDNIKTATSEAWDNVKKWSSEKWESAKETIKTSASNAWDSVKTNWNNIKDKTSTTWDDIKSKTSSTWDEVKSKTSNSAKDAWSNVNSWWSNLKKDTNSTFDEIVNKARSFGSSVGSALSGGWSYVYNGMKSQFKGMVEGAQWGVNQVIKGVKWVLNAVGAQGTANGISEWWPSYAKGTKYHPGGLALVNDGSGPYQEMYQLPNGKTGIFPKQRNMLVNLPRGTQVLDGKNTAKIIGAPAYAGGIFGSDFMKDFKIPSFNFDFDFSNIWSGFSSVASTVSDVASDVWGWVTDKASIVTHLWDKIGRGTGGFTDKAGAIVSGIKNKGIEAAKELIFQKGQEGSPSPSGTGIERWRGVITKALSMNGLPTSGNYVNAWLRQVQSESGGNEKAVQGGYVDINTLSGDLAKGLLQTISATFNAYKFPGHSNIFNGFDNALAAINYAKNRYGYSGMLDVIGHGHGYAQGTPWVPEDQLAMIHEGEMVVPAEYNPYNTLSNFQGFDRLQLPEVFNETPMDYNNFSTYGNSDDVSNYGINNMNNSLTNAIMMLIQKLGAEPTQDTNGDIIINIGGQEFGRIAVSEINKYHQQIGYTELNL